MDQFVFITCTAAWFGDASEKWLFKNDDDKEVMTLVGCLVVF